MKHIRKFNESKEEEISDIKDIITDFCEDYDIIEETPLFISRLHHDNTGVFYFIYDYPNIILFSVVHSSAIENMDKVSKINEAIEFTLIKRLELMGFECNYSKVQRFLMSDTFHRNLNQKNLYIKFE